MMYHGFQLGIIAVIIFVLLCSFFYFIPLIIAFYRKTANIWLVFLINLFFGWSIVGWLIALFFALSADSRPMKKCPYCLSNIDLKAKKCAYCGEWIDNNNSNQSTGENIVVK